MPVLKQKNTSLKQRLRSQATYLSQQELSKAKLLESIKQGRFSEKKPNVKEVKRGRYFDAVDKSPPMRIDEIAKLLNAKGNGGILAQFRKMEADGIQIIYIKDDPSRLPYVVRKTWLDEQQRK